MSRDRATEDQLREALHSVAGDVRPKIPPYRAMLGRYRQRERRRRLLLAAVVTIVFTAAVLVGLWIIDRSSTNTTFYSAEHRSQAQLSAGSGQFEGGPAGSRSAAGTHVLDSGSSGV